MLRDFSKLNYYPTWRHPAIEVDAVCAIVVDDWKSCVRRTEQTDENLKNCITYQAVHLQKP